MKCIDLFAGCGGLSLGFTQAEFEVIAALENWQPAIDVYEENFAHPVIKQDLTCNQVTKQLSLFDQMEVPAVNFNQFCLPNKVLNRMNWR